MPAPSRGVNAIQTDLVLGLSCENGNGVTVGNADHFACYGGREGPWRELKEEGLLNDQVVHRTVKYLNNRIEADHGKLKS
ncbi:MAG: hypothetical protein ACI8PB_004608 [Desulforhopalus sp.]|jgi:hypothetical protein